jgi:hypothetical protein
MCLYPCVDARFMSGIRKLIKEIRTLWLLNAHEAPPSLRYHRLSGEPKTATGQTVGNTVSHTETQRLLHLLASESASI